MVINISKSNLVNIMTRIFDKEKNYIFGNEVSFKNILFSKNIVEKSNHEPNIMNQI